MYNLKSLNLRASGGFVPRDTTKAPVYFGFSLYVHITSILATPLLRAEGIF